jgi:uncharacterized protein YkwD
MKFTILAIVLLSVVASHDAYFINIQKLTDRANHWRANPRAFAAYIKKTYLGAGKVNCSTGIHETWRLRFKEKCNAINEAIRALNRMKPVGALKIDEGFSKNAYEHSVYQVSKNHMMTHSGPNGRRGLGDRCKLYNNFRGYLGENIAYAMQGFSDDHDKLLAMWCIDDGVPSRGHRVNLFAAKFNSWGVGIKSTMYNGRKTDWVTTFFGTTASCCTRCPFRNRSTFHWKGIRSSSAVPKC